MKILLFYTDPGSGVMLLQILLATIAGAGFYFRSFIMRIFARRKNEEMTSKSSKDLHS